MNSERETSKEVIDIKKIKKEACRLFHSVHIAEGFVDKAAGVIAVIGKEIPTEAFFKADSTLTERSKRFTLEMPDFADADNLEKAIFDCFAAVPELIETYEWLLPVTQQNESVTRCSGCKELVHMTRGARQTVCPSCGAQVYITGLLSVADEWDLLDAASQLLNAKRMKELAEAKDADGIDGTLFVTPIHRSISNTVLDTMITHLVTECDAEGMYFSRCAVPSCEVMLDEPCFSTTAKRRRRDVEGYDVINAQRTMDFFDCMKEASGGFDVFCKELFPETFKRENAKKREKE